MKVSSLKKILIVRLSSLGDILLATPLIRSVKKKSPETEIDFMLRQEYSDVLRLNPHIRKIIPFRNSNIDEVKSQIRNEKYDAVIDLQNNLRSRGILAGMPVKARYHKKNLSKFLLVNFKINLLKDAPPVPERYISGISDIEPDEKGLELYTDKQPSIKPDDFNMYIGIAPGARHFTKRWPVEYYVELCTILNKEGFKVLLFGGTEDIPICNSIHKEAPETFNLVTHNDLLQISADMKICRSVICNDSGMMHVAAASGVPVIAVFGSTVKEFGFAPYRTKSRVLEHMTLPCRPCTHIGRDKCPKGHFKCLKEIPPQSVFSNLKDFISS